MVSANLLVWILPFKYQLTPIIVTLVPVPVINMSTSPVCFPLYKKNPNWKTPTVINILTYIYPRKPQLEKIPTKI